MQFFAILAGAFKALPAILSIYQSVVRLVGQAKAAKFAEDMESVSRLVERSRDPSIGFDERRRIRQKALQEGQSLWERSIP